MFEVPFEYMSSEEFYRKQKETEINTLKNLWLNHFPDSSHPTDLKNFIRYAIRLAKYGGALDFKEMEDHGISSARIEEYQRQYEFLRAVLDVIDEGTTYL